MQVKQNGGGLFEVVIVSGTSEVRRYISKVTDMRELQRQIELRERQND